MATVSPAVSQRLVAGIPSNNFLLLIGQKARNSGCDWFIQLSDNGCPITPFFIGHSLINDFAARLRKNRVLIEPTRFEEIVVFVMNFSNNQLVSYTDGSSIGHVALIFTNCSISGFSVSCGDFL